MCRWTVVFVVAFGAVMGGEDGGYRVRLFRAMLASMRGMSEGMPSVRWIVVVVVVVVGRGVVAEAEGDAAGCCCCCCSCCSSASAIARPTRPLPVPSSSLCQSPKSQSVGLSNGIIPGSSACLSFVTGVFSGDLEMVGRGEGGGGGERQKQSVRAYKHRLASHVIQVVPNQVFGQHHARRP